MVELATKADLLATEHKLQTSITEVQTELRATKADLVATEQRLQTRIDTQTLQLTVRLGAMQVVLIGALVAILKLT